MVRSAVLGPAPYMPAIGRAEELDRMESILDSVQASSGHLLLLTGEAGAGKTRLLQELATDAVGRGFAVAASVCEGSGSQSSYHVFRRCLPALRDVVPTQVRAETERRWELLRTRMQSQVSSDTGMVPDDDLLEDAGNLILNAAAAAPVALLIDDLQAIDAKSLEMLHYLVRATHSSRVLIACSLRNVASRNPELQLTGVLQKLSHDRLLDLVTVPRLSYDETASYISESMQGSVSEEFIGFAHRRTKGNPRLLDGLGALARRAAAPGRGNRRGRHGPSLSRPRRRNRQQLWRQS